MMTWLGLVIFATAWVAWVVFWEKNRTAVHFIGLFVMALVAFITSATEVTHYWEVRFLKALDVNDLICVSVGEAPKMTDREQLQNAVAGLRTPKDFLASRGDQGDGADFTLGFKDGTQNVFTISRAARTRGAVVRIKGGGTVLYEDLEWVIPASL